MLDAFMAAAADLLMGRAPPTAYLVHAGMLFYAGGLLMSNQLWLRLLLLAGVAMDICYFAFHPETPLWDAIFAASVIGSANVVGLISIALDRLPIFLDDDRRAVLDACEAISPGTILPGELRRMMKGEAVELAAHPVPVTTRGEVPEAFFLLIDGRAQVAGADSGIVAHSPCFIAEIAFITHGPASADVVLLPRTRYVRFDRARLMRRMKKHTALDRSLRALISYDLSTKLAATVPVFGKGGESAMDDTRAGEHDADGQREAGGSNGPADHPFPPRNPLS